MTESLVTLWGVKGACPPLPFLLCLGGNYQYKDDERHVIKRTDMARDLMWKQDGWSQTERCQLTSNLQLVWNTALVLHTSCENTEAIAPTLPPRLAASSSHTGGRAPNPRWSSLNTLSNSPSNASSHARPTGDDSAITG